jgi:predicted nucleic acid-binding Zn finger protein
MTTKHETKLATSVIQEREHEVMLFNCNCHTYEEVIDALMRAIKCDRTTAIRYALIAEQFDQVAVYKGAREDCEKVAAVLGSTGLRVAVV